MPVPQLSPGRSSARPSALALVALLALAVAGCSGRKEQPKPPPPLVGIVIARPGPVALDTELPGRTAAYLVSDVRPQISGLVLKRLFTEGSLVHAGQPLYQIDPALYRASVGQAQGLLASARANAVAARAKTQRYDDLEKINAVARQDAADARAAAGQADAAIQQQQAALQTARINLRYTTITAPISGRIGRSTVTPGALVTASQADALSTIQTLDPIYVDIQQSSTDLLKLRRAIAGGGVMPSEAAVRLKLEDGTVYPLAGKLEFSEVTVDPSTGAVTLRARFPNPRGLLLPGMYVRAVISQAVQQDAFLLPEQGLAHDAKGDASVLIVVAGNKVVSRPVRTQGIRGGRWIVTGGLKPGDRVIIEGSGKAKPGQPVRTAIAAGGPAEAAIIDASSKTKASSKTGGAAGPSQ